MIELLLKPVVKFCELTGRVLKIYGTATNANDVYLIRYYLFQNKYFNVFIHIFLRSDRDDMHDHPWNFGTYIVRGGYREEVPNRYTTMQENFETNVRSTKQARWATRKAEQLHRVKLDKEYSLAEKDKAPMTICVTGKTRRDWGFMKKIDANTEQWIFWKKYLGLPDDAPSRG